jgi:hypothetical protein
LFRWFFLVFFCLLEASCFEDIFDGRVFSFFGSSFMAMYNYEVKKYDKLDPASAEQPTRDLVDPFCGFQRTVAVLGAVSLLFHSHEPHSKLDPSRRTPKADTTHGSKTPCEAPFRAMKFGGLKPTYSAASHLQQKCIPKATSEQ